MRLIFTLIFGCTISIAVAQKETAIWYFGYNAGLDFNSGSPVSINGGQLSTDEGVSAISDANGNLIMYTDGITVWNKNHSIMPNGNGLLGDPSSAQSGIIVPKPGNAQIYYVFTVAVEGSVDGIRYSEVNLSLNGGNGDVTTTKNVFLVGPSSEKLTAVKHANGTDIWVVTQTDGSNQYYAFLVSAAGVSLAPVISAVGPANLANQAGDGYLKFSSDGTKLANAYFYGNLLELFNFNPSTGLISNPISMPFVGVSPYGVEFSTSGNILYVTTDTGRELDQFDVSNWNAASILASKINFNSGLTYNPYALQMALDGKIYFCMNGTTSIGVINNPDILGIGCNVVPNIVTLSGLCRFGLPQFITSYFLSSSFTFTDLCFGDSTHFTSAVNPAPDSVLWNFGVSSTTLDTSTLLNPAYLFPDTGTYIITLYSWLNNLADTAMDTIHISGKFLVPMADLPICNGGSAVFDATHLGASYLWNNNTSNASLTVNSPGIYWVDITKNGCTLRDSVQANLVTFSFSLGNDTTLCPNINILKTLNVLNASYAWNSGNKASSELLSPAGTFWVDVTVQGCIQRDSIVITYFSDPLFIGNDTILCFDTSSITLVSNIIGSAYLWNTGATSPSIMAHPDSMYILQVIDANTCILKDTVHVSFNTPKIALGEDISACLGDDFTLSVDKPEFVEYHWSTGQHIPTISVNQTGMYYVQIKDINGCYAQDTISFDFTGCSLFIPSAFTPDEDIHNRLFRAYGENIIDFNLKIYNRWGQNVFETSDITKGWDGTHQGTEANLGVYTYILEYRDAIHLKFKKKCGSIALIR